MDSVALPKKARVDWRGLSLASLSGLLLALAYPPVSLWWLAYLALIPLYRVVLPRTNLSPQPPPPGTRTSLGKGETEIPPFLVRNERPGEGARGRGFSYGFAFAFTLYAIGMFWMNALATPLWATLCVIMGVIFGLWAWLTARIVPHCPAWLRPLVFAAGWTLFEWVRSLGVYAFPWFLLATSQTHPLALYFAQAADIGAQWLVTFAIAAINGYLAEGIGPPVPPKAGIHGGGGGKSLLLALGIFLALGIYGANTSPQYVGKALEGKDRVPVAIVQGNEDKSASWEERLQLYLELSRSVSSQNKLMLWPEGTVHARHFYAAENLARQKNIPIMSGLSALDEIEGQARPRNIVRLSGYPNEYIKRRLAPFGEVYPFRKQLASVYKSFGVNVDSYQTGIDPAVFEVGGLHIGPVICYESAFPWVSRETIRAGADTLAFITSDQTFDGTPEHAQHLALVQLRCIETRRYGVRAATSGISAELYPNGQVAHRIESQKRGLLNATVIPLSGRTLAVWWGDWWLLVCAAIVGEAIRRATWARPKP